MPLVVEDGTGYSNADSYVGIAEADTFHASRGNDAWGPLSAARKEVLLRLASDYVTGKYRYAFIGRKAVAGQSLEWPRYSNEPGWFNLRLAGVPIEVRQATAELALIANTQSLTDAPKRGKKSVKVGPISVEYDPLSYNQNQFVSANLKLAPWLKSGGMNGSMVRLNRA